MLYPARPPLGEFDLSDTAGAAAARAKEAARIAAIRTSELVSKLGEQKKALEAKYGARAVAGFFLGLSIGRRAPTLAMWLGYASLAVFINERSKAYARGEIKTVRDLFQDKTSATQSPAPAVESGTPVLVPGEVPKALSGWHGYPRRK